jgi:hydroxypyruvate isomerase
MSKIKQSISWWCFVPAKLSAEKFVQEVARAGYPAIELVPPEYWALVKSYGLEISSIVGHKSIVSGLNRRDNHARIEAELRMNIENAQKWGIPNLICFSGNRAGLDDAFGLEVTAEGFARITPVAEASGVTLLLELLNSKVDHPDYQADHTAWGAEVCKRVASSHVRLLYDIYHMQITEGDVIRTIRTYHEWIGHYHTAGNPGRNDLDDAQELHYPAILRAITAVGYSGYIAHEFVPKGEPVLALKKTFTDCALFLS